MCSCSVPLTFTFRDVHIKYICLVYRLRQLKLKDQLVPVDLFGITNKRKNLLNRLIRKAGPFHKIKTSPIMNVFRIFFLDLRIVVFP